VRVVIPGYDRWLESGPGGPNDDGEIVCPDCEGDADENRPCRRCDGTGKILESDDES
jgi:RecJ-like exonuclease